MDTFSFLRTFVSTKVLALFAKYKCGKLNKSCSNNSEKKLANFKANSIAFLMLIFLCKSQTQFMLFKFAIVDLPSLL